MTISHLPLLAACATLLQAEDSKVTVQAIYDDTLRAIQTAKTKEDVARMVDGIDVPEWTSVLPNGRTLTLAQALPELEGILRVPLEQRPRFRMDPIHWSETPAGLTVVYWAYVGAGSNITGSIARDTWARTARGWRRTKHEKLFPDRPLVKDGKPALLPTP